MIKITPLKINNFKNKDSFYANAKFDEKNAILKKAGFDNNQTAFINAQDRDFIDKLLQVIKFEYSPSRAIELAKLNDEDFQKLLDLQNKGVAPHNIPPFFELEKRERKKSSALNR